MARSLRFSFEVIVASIPRIQWWQPGLRSCIMTGLPTRLVLELNVGTVPAPNKSEGSCIQSVGTKEAVP